MEEILEILPQQKKDFHYYLVVFVTYSQKKNKKRVKFGSLNPQTSRWK